MNIKLKDVLSYSERAVAARGDIYFYTPLNYINALNDYISDELNILL
jgi:hypothetical protein